MTLTAEQQNQRAQGIGASEIAAVAGLNPWAGPHDVWERKTGRAPPWEDTVASLWGRYMEPAIIALWRAKTGTKVRYANRHQRTAVHPTNPLCVATPDGFVPPDTGLEVKTYGWRLEHHWGEPGTDEIPDYYLAQVNWQMAATGRTKTILLASHEREVDEYRIAYDEEFYQALAEVGARFWRDHVETDTPPPADHRERCRAILDRYYPRPTGKELMPCTPDATDLAIQLRDAETAMKEAQKRLDLAKNQAAEYIGDQYGVHTELGKVLWYPVAGRRTAKARELHGLAARLGASDAELDACYSEGQGYRVVRGYWRKK